MLLNIFFFKSNVNLHIGIKVDNTIAVAYINNMGGITSEDMDFLASSIWDWCLERNIWLSAQYIPGVDNHLADYSSRVFNLSAEWKLKSEVFDKLCNHFYYPDVDLFVSPDNCRLDNFVSLMFHPDAWNIDTFSFSWNGLIPYFFPPFNLIGRIVTKIKEESVSKAIIVFPLWRTQPWFSLLISCLVSIPVRLPRHADLLTTRWEERHPMGRKLQLAAGIISGIDCKVWEFQETLEELSSLHGDDLHQNSMILHGTSGCFGVVNKKLIPLDQQLRIC